MGSLLGRLQAREAACRARVEELRAEMDELGERLAAEEEKLSRLVITRETVQEVLAGPDLPEDIAFAAAARAAAGAGEGAGELVDDGDAAVRAALRNPSRPSRPSRPGVPVWRQGAGVDGLPEVYRDVLGVLAAAERSGQGPLRAKDICAELGLGGEPRHVEGLRSRLKRLVERGWLTQVQAGRFALAEGVAGPGEYGAG